MSAPEPLKPAYLIFGSDRPKVRRALARLRGRVEHETGSDLNVTVLDAQGLPPEAVVEAACTPGFTLGTRLLLVVNAHHWKAAQRRLLVGYLEDPMPDTCLAIEGETFAKDDALRKAVTRVGDVLAFDLPKKYEMAGWVRARAKAHGLPMNLAVARHLLDRCGADPRHGERLEREIEKLALYCHGAEASAGDVDAVCTPDDDERVFALMDAVGHRDAARSFRLLEAVLASTEKKDDANTTLYTLKRHIELLDAAAQLHETDQATAAKQLKVQPFRARKLLEQCASWDRRRLGRAYRALAAAEAGMRGRAPATLESAGGVNQTDRLVMELALARLLA
jgi:DNA polymerase-3 subunit delta